jgi:three-Cys-motif partner protein
MARSKGQIEGQQWLFPDTDFHDPQHKFKPLTRPLWTERKAALVARYLHYFVIVTKHGTYLDAFAGRQSEHAQEGWAVEEVLKNRPDWIRKFHLFERSESKCDELAELKAAYPGRKIEVFRGDTNLELPARLAVGSLREKEASFCLLDQRTFECKWDLCRHVAAIKSTGFKVEQFYFLAQGWLDRAFSGIKTEAGNQLIRDWWGRDDSAAVQEMAGFQRAEEMTARFRQELGYAEAYPWPIRANEPGSRVMYYMIHATDHPAAAPLMRRAYEWAVAPVAEDTDQLEMEFESISWPHDIEDDR